MTSDVIGGPSLRAGASASAPRRSVPRRLLAATMIRRDLASSPSQQ
jgi:hypothetical protein